jgi:hypothetical protein
MNPYSNLAGLTDRVRLKKAMDRILETPISVFTVKETLAIFDIHYNMSAPSTVWDAEAKEYADRLEEILRRVENKAT